jgi:2-keto-3-deoxy-L-rhamnonate aldolase RhmA
VVPGIYASTPDHARTYSTMGFKLIAIGNELTYVRIGGELLLEAAREAEVPADEAVAAQR